MSFQDFSSSRPRNTNTAATHPTTTTGPGRPQAPISSGGGSSSQYRPTSSTTGRGDALSQISEALLQYQRNVGILENIVASMTTTRNTSELQAQYAAQVDVLEHLSNKVRSLLAKTTTTSSSTTTTTASSTTTTTATAKTKLERDFERVQSRASALQERVARFQKATAASTHPTGGSSSSSSSRNEASASSTSSSAAANKDYHQQVQLQLQQDRLAEEIMREREEEIRNINRGMHQVNEIYKDLAHIVGTQQEHIDTIETQMDESRVNAESGLKQVEKANEKFGNSNCVIS